MVGSGGVARSSNFNGLKSQTYVWTRIERKGIFGAITNCKTDIPTARNAAGRHIAPRDCAKAGAASCTNFGAVAAQGIDRHSSGGLPSQRRFFGGAYSGAQALIRDKRVAGSNVVTPTRFFLFDTDWYDPLETPPKVPLGQLSAGENRPRKECVRITRRAPFAATRFKTFEGEERNRGLVISLEGLRAFGGFSTFSDKPDSFRAFDNKQLIDPVRITLPHSTLSDEGCAPTGAS